MPRPCPSTFIGACGGGCPPCASPCPPSPCCPGGGIGACSVVGTMFAQGTPNSVLPGGTAIAATVPGLITMPFLSVVPEKLAIDASAFVELVAPAGAGDGEAIFEVLVDGMVVAGSQFGTLFSLPDEDPQRFSQSTTLLFEVPAGAHVVSVQWSSPDGSVGTTATLLAGNLRVERLACV